MCELYSEVPYVYAIATPIWLLFFAEWSYSVFLRHADVAKDLHRLLLWVPLIAVLHCAASAFHYGFCPWLSLFEQLLGSVWIILTILKEPVMLVCLLLVAKGWGITRPRLEVGELAVSSLVRRGALALPCHTYAHALATRRR